ncbi:MAG TPA: ATP-binding protein [Actinomycetota bacterium]|nr:ATP-binding protein [Actinomycetota bacterium]
MLAERQRDASDGFNLSLRPEPRYVGTARAFGAAVARHFQADEERIQDVKVAISEACSNAIKAHRNSAVNEPIQVVVRQGTSTLRYEIIDAGEGFEAPTNPPPVQTPILSPDSPELFEGGIGLMLIRSLFPDAEVIRNPDGGMTVSFQLALDDRTAAAS